jgi:hypothetical protein
MNTLKALNIKISHDLQRRILEITSLIRVLNNYYFIKNNVQNQIKPLVLSKLKEGIQTLEHEKDWLYSIPTTLTRVSDDYLSRKDSFKFPDSIILFEAWMNLGMGALFPRIALHYKFPGLLKGEKVRNLLQFTFATSRGFGFPIYFGPEFYGYHLTYGRCLETIFRWSHTVCHRANQAIYLVGNKYKIKRHHPGEFESIIISEYENNNFKAIDTLLHGYFTNAPRSLGKYSDFNSTLENIVFSYSIGDHAMSINSKIDIETLKVSLIPHEYIVKHYNVDFYSYIVKLKVIRLLLIKKILQNKRKKKEILSKLKFMDKSKLKFNKTFIQLSFNVKIMEKLLYMLWTTPLYTQTVQTESSGDEIYSFQLKNFDSVFLEYIKEQEIEWNLTFQEKDLINKLEDLKNHMASMWLAFKEKHFNFAIKKLNALSTLSLKNPKYITIINDYLENLIPIFSIYEIFSRSLSESVYPESIPQTKRLGAYFAKFLTSKYNLFGINLMHFFNKLAYRNWSYLIKKKRITLIELFNFILKLPIWKYIPLNVKERILQSNMEYNQ